MAGVLQFTLGLATGNLLTNAARAAEGIKGITAAALKFPVIGAAVTSAAAGFTSFHSAVEKVFAQIEKGAELEHLSRRTGESVRNLFTLQKAFKSTGLDAGSVSTVLLQMQKALGGFNDMGEPTKDVFAGLGLSVDVLKEAQAPEALLAITQALARLNRAEATNIAAKIFGRGGAGDALQIARSGNEFAEALTKAGKQSGVFERQAAAFAKIARDLEAVKGRANGFFAGIAEGVGPAIQVVLTALNKIDLTKIGQQIGNVLGVVVQAVKDGKLGELLELSLTAGFTRAFTFASALFGNLDFWSGIGQAALGGLSLIGTGLVRIFTSVNAFNKALMIKGFEEVIAKFTGGKLRDFLGIPQDFKPHTFKELFAAESEANVAQFNSLFGNNMSDAFGFIRDGTKDVNSAVQGAIAAATGGPAEQRLKELYKNLFNALPRGPQEANAEAARLETPAAKLKKQKQDVNDLERIGGLFFNRGTSPMEDSTRRTADNTQRTAVMLGKIHELLNQPGKVKELVNR